MPLAFIYGQTAAAGKTGKCNSSAITLVSVLLGTQNLYLFIIHVRRTALNDLQIFYNLYISDIK